MTTMVLMDNGKVLVWGENRKSLINDIEAISSPTELTSLSHLRVKSVYNYSFRFFVITEEYKVYSWGWNYYDNLGHVTDAIEVMSPTLIDGLSQFEIVDIASAHKMTHLLSSNGKVFYCGVYKYQQTTQWQRQPVLMDTKEKFIQLQYINNNCLGLSDNGTVYQFQCNNIDRKNKYRSFQQFCLRILNSTNKTQNYSTPILY